MDDEKAIRKLIETWMQATKEGDLATVLSLMSDDVIFMVPGKEPFGKRNLQQHRSSSRTFRSMARAMSRKSKSLAIGLTFELT